MFDHSRSWTKELILTSNRAQVFGVMLSDLPNPILEVMERARQVSLAYSIGEFMPVVSHIVPEIRTMRVGPVRRNSRKTKLPGSGGESTSGLSVQTDYVKL